MMRRIFTLILAVVAFFNLQAQDDGSLNMELLSNMTYSESVSDIWGYVAPDGREYAIVGTNTTTSVVDLSDPANPVEVASIPGAPSPWRDFKTFGEFVYVTTDRGTDGLVVIDMSGAPNNITSTNWRPMIEVNGSVTQLSTCHNIFIDEDGFGYLAGCNLNSGGVLIIDLFSTPGLPQFVSASDARYSHDVMVQDNLLYSSDINNGFFSVIDVSDKTDPMTLSTQTTTSFFTHNAWVSTDNNFLFTTDERANSNVDAYDISDLTDIKLLDVFQPESTRGQGTVPHNTHYFNGFLVTSWYTDGVRIIDANKPDNLVEVAFFDTFAQSGGGTQGLWGVTPYLPSGLVIGSDISTGLYVFDVDYVRAAYLEGNVTDADTGEPLSNVSVEFNSTQLTSKKSNALGDYKTGLAEAGNFMVTFKTLGYKSQVVPATIVNGEVTILNIALEPSTSFSITGTIRSLVDNSPIENGKVLFQSEEFEFEVASDANGDFTVNSIFEGEYIIYSGAWGYENIEVNNSLSLNQNESIDILLGERIMDDFIVDLGWTVTNQAQTGAWVREIPIGTSLGGASLSNPDADIEGDIGNKAFVTGNLEGGVGDADVDGGSVILTSPLMDLTTFVQPIISYNLWFVNAGGGDTPNDNVSVQISNGNTSIDVEILNVLDSDGVWRSTSTFLPEDFLEITSTMQFSVTAVDDEPGHLVEAGLDKFLVSETTTSTSDLVSTQIFQSSPNPFSEFTTLDFNEEVTGQLVVTNILGQLIETIDLENTVQVQLGENYIKGVYLVSLEANTKKFEAVKMIKQ